MTDFEWDDASKTIKPITETDAVEELRAMIESADHEKGVTIFNHTPEEFGLHVMENSAEILAALSHPLQSESASQLFPDWGKTEAERIAKLEEALRTLRNFGCPVCSGDCGSANPPVQSCPMMAVDEALRTHPQLATQGIKAGTDEPADAGSAEGESPVLKGCAQ